MLNNYVQKISISVFINVSEFTIDNANFVFSVNIICVLHRFFHTILGRLTTTIVQTFWVDLSLKNRFYPSSTSTMITMVTNLYIQKENLGGFA